MADALQILKKNPLFANLTVAELKHCYSLMEKKTYQENEYVVHQGEKSTELYVITSGSVAVLHRGHQLAVLKEGDIFGEVELIDRTPRAASIMTLEPAEFFILSQKNFHKLSEDLTLCKKLERNLLCKLTDRLRYTNEVTVTSLEKQVELDKMQLNAGTFMVILMTFLTTYTFLFSGLAHLTKVLGTAAVITMVASLILLVIFFIYAKKTGYPMSFFGFTTKKWSQMVIQAVVYTAPVLVLMTIFKFILIKYLPQYTELELFDLGKKAISTGNTSRFTIILMAFSYLFISTPIQEILFRGGLQSSLQFFLLNKHKYLLSIVMTSIVFAMMHLHMSFLLAVIVFFLGLFWGYLYMKQKSLIGVIVSHLLIGGFAFFVLGVQSIVFMAT